MIIGKYFVLSHLLVEKSYCYLSKTLSTFLDETFPKTRTNAMYYISDPQHTECSNLAEAR